MKNEDIHNGLKNKEVRDFLGKTHRINERKSKYRNSKDIEKDIKELQELLEYAKNAEAVEQLIKNNGWEMLDIDEEKVEFNLETYFSFIGTKKEYEKIFGKSED